MAVTEASSTLPGMAPKESAQCTPLTSTTPSLLEAGTLAPTASESPIPAANPPRPGGHRRGWMAQFKEDINLSYADLPVLACCVVSGLCDSVAFNAGGVFVSMQTGEFPRVAECCCIYHPPPT